MKRNNLITAILSVIAVSCWTFVFFQFSHYPELSLFVWRVSWFFLLLIIPYRAIYSFERHHR